MGLYDCRCMVSGVSLQGADATLVLLQQTADAYRPIALAITGNYNRLGSIDGIEEDANTRLVLKFFLEKLQSGEFVVDASYHHLRDLYPIEDIEQLLGCFERNINDYDQAAMLAGRPVVFALICRAVWKALARSSPPADESATPLLQQVFKDIPVAEAIYHGSLSQVSRHLRELSAVSNFLADRGLAWRPADDPGQDCAEEMRQYLEEAKQTFRDSSVVLEGLKEYEREVGDLLEEERG